MEIRPEYEVSVGEGMPRASEGPHKAPDTCHDHSHDDHAASAPCSEAERAGEVHFWLRASITPGQLHALKRDLKDAQTEIQNLRAVIRAYLEHDEAANYCTCQACRALVEALGHQ